MMMPPKCTVFPPSTRYKRVVVRSLRYDNDGRLTIEVQGTGFAFASVVFRRPAEFRVLDDRDLCEFWDHYQEGLGPVGQLFQAAGVGGLVQKVRFP